MSPRWGLLFFATFFYTHIAPLGLRKFSNMRQFRKRCIEFRWNMRIPSEMGWRGSTTIYSIAHGVNPPYMLVFGNRFVSNSCYNSARVMKVA